MTYTDSADDDPYAALPPDPGTEPVDPTAAEQDPEFMAQLARRYRNPAAGMGVQPDAPVSAESDILPLAAGAAGTLLSHIGQGYASMGRGIGDAVSGAYGSLKEALAAYANGDNAAPPAVVDAAMQKAADKLGPNADKSKVVQAAIAGTADPLSPDYMNQAGRDVFGGAGGATTGQAPARTGYDQTQTVPTIASTAAPAALAQAVNPPLSRQDLIERGVDAKQADRIINAGDPNDPLTKGLSRFLPDGFLDDPNNRKNLQDMLSTQQEKRVYQEYVTPEGFSAGRLSGLSKVIGHSNPYINATDRGSLENLAHQLIDQANSGGATTAGDRMAALTGGRTTGQAAATAAPTAPLTQQQLIRQGMTPEASAGVIEDAGGMVDALGPKLNRYLPPGFLNDPYNRAQLSELTTRRGQPMSGSGEGGRQLGKADYLEPGGNSGIYESLAVKLLNRANNHAAALAGNTNAPSDRFNPWGADQTQQAQQTPALQRQVESGYNPSNMQRALRMRAAGALPSDIQRQQDMRNLTYDPTGAQEAPEPPMRSSGDGGGGTSRNTNRNTKTRAPAARGRRSDLDTGTEAPVQTAMADSGTMSDASNDIRSTVPAGAQVAAAGQTGYANQPPAPGGFSGAAGPATDVAVRQGAFTPAGAPVPAAPAAPAELPNGMKLVPTSGGQYDRAIVGSDGRVMQYIPKGQPSPSPQQAADIMFQSNTAEMENRLAHGDPTAIADLQARAAGRPGVDRSKPLPPAQAATAESMAATQAEQARRARGGFAAPPPAPGGGQLPPPPQPTGNKAVDAQNMAIWKEQAIAARGSVSQQNAQAAIQQRAAAAAQSDMSRQAQQVLTGIRGKITNDQPLTDDEKAIVQEYNANFRKRFEQMTQGQAAAPGIRSTLQNAAGGQQPVRVNSMADAARLPRGTQFLDPNGNLRTVP